MWLVAALGAVAGVGVAVLLPAVPAAPPVGLRGRLAPAADPATGLTPLTTLLAYTGLFTVYTYISAAFAGATGGRGTVLAALLSSWGIAAVAGNLADDGQAANDAGHRPAATPATDAQRGGFIASRIRLRESSLQVVAVRPGRHGVSRDEPFEPDAPQGDRVGGDPGDAVGCGRDRWRPLLHLGEVAGEAAGGACVGDRL
jgi:hypothetical protein